MSSRPWLDPHLPIEERIELLLSEMSLEEKIAQMHQTDGGSRACGEDLTTIGHGSILNASGPYAGNVRDDGVYAEKTNALQKIAVEQSRLGIPMIFGRDVIHGHRTVFPIPLGQAASFNPELVQQAAAHTAREAASEGVHWTFAPMMDVSRDPRWGRIAESFGEDVHLSAVMAVAMVKGFQGDNPGAPDRMAACAKHFAGYGGAEGGRDYWEVHCGERELRDVYLPPFRAALAAGCATVMSAFHVIDGVPTSADRHLLTDILKKEWGFDGFVVSDYGIVSEMHTGHGVCESLPEAGELAANAGLDMDMMSFVYRNHLAESVRSGRVALEQIDDAVRRVLRVKFRCGLFENPYTDESLAPKVLLHADHKATARTIVHESTVLLKNNGILPLRSDLRKIAVIGPLARARGELHGTWCLDGRPEDVVSIGDALTELAGPGVHVHVDSPTAWGDLTPIICRDADVVVACLGEGPWRSGEGNSVATIDLPVGQIQLLREIKKLGVPIVAIVCAGRPLGCTELDDLVDALLYAWHPGTMGGYGLADLLLGKAVPSGRLPVSFPRTTGQIPVHYSHRATHRPQPDWDRTKSWYRDEHHYAHYPFGFGLSYTTFSYTDLVLDTPEISREGTLQVTVTVHNGGERDAYETPQLYIRDIKGSVSRPVRELKGFTKVLIPAKESVRVEFSVPATALSFTNAQLREVIEPGEFSLWVGPNARDGLSAQFRVV